MRISVLPPVSGTIATRCISAVQRQSGNSVEPATSRRSNFDMTPPVPVGKLYAYRIGSPSEFNRVSTRAFGRAGVVPLLISAFTSKRTSDPCTHFVSVICPLNCGAVSRVFVSALENCVSRRRRLVLPSMTLSSACCTPSPDPVSSPSIGTATSLSLPTTIPPKVSSSRAISRT